MRASGALRSVRPRRLDVRRIVLHDFPLKAVAVLIATLFWLALSQNAAPHDMTITFDGRVPIERPQVPDGFVLRGQFGDVGVKLSGPSGVVDRIGLSDLRATLDLTGVDAGTQPRDAKVHVTVSNPQVKVVDVSPLTVAVRLERITSRTIAVQTRFANDPPAGWQVARASVAPSEVRVSGPESAVAQIAAVFATVRFGDAASDLSQSVPAQAVDAAGLPIDGLEVDPGVVVVRVPLLPTATTKTVPVLWNIRGAVAAGYWISQVSPDPLVVTVSGDQSVLSKVSRVDTAPIDVAGLDATRAFRSALVLPEGVSLLQPVTATVTVTVVPLAGSRPFVIAVTVTGLGTGLTATTDPSTVSVVLSGPAPTLAALGPDQITVTVDATGRDAGTYTVDVATKVPAGTVLQSVQPGRVTLTITSKT